VPSLLHTCGPLLVAAAIFAACDVPAPEPPGSVEVLTTFLDGSAMDAVASVVMPDPRGLDPRGLPYPFLHQSTARAVSGRVVFDGLPAGRYFVAAHPYEHQEPEVSSTSGDGLDLREGDRVRQEVLFGYRYVTEPEAVASLPSRERAYPGQLTEGVAVLFRYDLPALRVGAGHIRVRAVRSHVGDLFVRAEEGGAVTVRLYRIPEQVRWAFNDPGALTYATFREGMQPARTYTLPLPEGHGSGRAGHHTFSFDPALFFGAPNGIAMLVEGEGEVTASSPGHLWIDYDWDP